jgi:ketosteroid isomerase-like protein
MKKSTIVLVVLFFCSYQSFCQSKKETEIRYLETYWGELLDKSDTTALRKIWSKDYIVNNPAGKVITGEDIIGFIRNGQRFPAYKRNIESITFSENIAIVIGSEVSQPTKKADGTETITKRRFTNIWIKSKKSWQLLARQATNI